MVLRYSLSVHPGMTVHGVADVVISGGRVVKDEEGLHLTQGAGKFIPTPPNAPYVYGRVAARVMVSVT